MYRDYYFVMKFSNFNIHNDFEYDLRLIGMVFFFKVRTIPWTLLYLPWLSKKVLCPVITQ